MKGKVLIAIIFGTIIFSILRYNRYFDGRLVEIRTAFVPNTCGKEIDLKVIVATDTSVSHLINKKISAELPFHQSKLNEFIKDKLNAGDTSGFLIIGYPVQGRKLHCSGSTCFTVRRIKTILEKSFTEL